MKINTLLIMISTPETVSIKLGVTKSWGEWRFDKGNLLKREYKS